MLCTPNCSSLAASVASVRCPEPASSPSPPSSSRLVLAACGAAGGAADADPASAVPAGTAIYLEGVVRPEGDQREDVLDAARKVLRTDDPEAQDPRADRQGPRGLRPQSKTTYKDDIAPWLGEKAGVWVAGVDRKEPGYVVVIAAKDTEKAQEAIDKGVKSDGGKVTQRSYSGVDYQVDDEGVAAGIVGDFFTVGTEAEFKRTVKAQDGDSLAEEKRYESAIDGLEDDRIGSVLRRPQAVHRAGAQVRPAGRGASSSSSARSSRSTSSSRSAARCWPTGTGSPSTRSRAGRASTR